MLSFSVACIRATIVLSLLVGSFGRSWIILDAFAGGGYTLYSTDPSWFTCGACGSTATALRLGPTGGTYNGNQISIMKLNEAQAVQKGIGYFPALETPDGTKITGKDEIVKYLDENPGTSKNGEEKKNEEKKGEGKLADGYNLPNNDKNSSSNNSGSCSSGSCSGGGSAGGGGGGLGGGGGALGGLMGSLGQMLPFLMMMMMMNQNKNQQPTPAAPLPTLAPLNPTPTPSPTPTPRPTATSGFTF